MNKPKERMTMDGNTAAAYTSYAFTEVAGIYPITPSSPMADMVDIWAQEGRKNIFGQTVNVVEMQSEGGAAGFVHGSLGSGALTTTYTASQGLLLMIPNMYKMAGELLPAVFHVSARTLATHALSIFGDHSDVMAARQTGFVLLASGSVQEAMDLAAVSHLSAIKGRVPFLHFFDGFRTSHEIQKIEVLDYDDLAALVDQDALAAFRARGLSPNHPSLRGTAQNPDVFFQAREASNPYYEAITGIVVDYMDKISALTGRTYKPFVYTGAPDAEKVIVCMGSVTETAIETMRYLNAAGEKYGVLTVHLYRPFNNDMLRAELPETVKRIAVLDRTKEPGAAGEPLYLDVVNAFAGIPNAPMIVGGRYGLGSKDTTPDQIVAVYKNLETEQPKHGFTIGIVDDVTHLSLPVETHINVAPEGTIAARFWGLGSDGTVGANKNSIKIIGDHTDMYAQAYFSYDSKKSGGITISDLRFGKHPIRAPYLVNRADFVACHNQAYIGQYDMLAPLRKGGIFLLNTLWSVDELEEKLPAELKREIAQKEIQFYILDAVTAAENIGLGSRINTICQSAFFKLANVMPVEDAVTYMKQAIDHSYGDKGEDIVNMNYKAVDAGLELLLKVDVPASWGEAPDDEPILRDVPDFIKNVVDVMNRQKGDELPVSTFADRADGTFPQGTSQYEKRGIAVNIPMWIPENCIQCNQCSYVCPHAVIRPFLMEEEELEGAPEAFKVIDGMRPYNQYKYRIQMSALDCTGCGSCAQVCPAKEKALQMRPLAENRNQIENWEFAIRVPRKENPMDVKSVKGSQFELPMLEFSGACAGCGETPYVKLVTQLFGERMQIANATGCTSIWGASAPATPYTYNKDGHGPSWANSLFEDNAEFGLGMHLATKQLRRRAKNEAEQLMDSVDGDVKEALDTWLTGFHSSENTRQEAEALIDALEKYDGPAKADADRLHQLADYFMLRSTWIIGGDGWAYDIGYGGLDHVLASGENVNVLVLDTEVYSNTGGQASKATQLGAVAQFAAGGKPIRKKDLGAMAMSYGYVYVAQVSMGANQLQTLRAIREAEAFDGPSLVIAYAPCINHGIRGGLTYSQEREKIAVETGYWHLYRFNPADRYTAKNPFTLDSKAPTRPYSDFLEGEVRYTSLKNRYTDEQVLRIFESAAEAAAERYDTYKRLADTSLQNVRNPEA